MHPDILPLHAAIEEEHWWFVARRGIVRTLLTEVEAPDPEKQVLDLGCGTGGNLGGLKGVYGCVGIEQDEAAVRVAAEKYPGCRFECASIFEPQQWGVHEPSDICLLMDVIEHLDDDETAVFNAVEALKHGGHLLITVPADPRLWGRHDHYHEHRRRYTRENLARLLESFPLRPRLLSYFNSRLYYPIRAYRWFQNHLDSHRPKGTTSEGTTGDLTRQPGWLNAMLTRVFLGELNRLRAALDEPEKAYGQGVSLIAIYRKDARP